MLGLLLHMRVVDPALPLTLFSLVLLSLHVLLLRNNSIGAELLNLLPTHT